MIVKRWVDFLCGHCYRHIKTITFVKETELSEEVDEPQRCPNCGDWVFCVQIYKREFRRKKLKEESIEHGIEIFKILGQNMQINLEVPDKYEK